MNSRKVVLLVGALVMAVISAVLARSLYAGSSAPQAAAVPTAAPVPTGPQVLVATRALPVGTILDATALKFQPWPAELVENAYYTQGSVDLRSLQGTVVRNPITAGQPITQGNLVHPGDRGFLAAALGPGMRAVTVPVSAQSAVAGFVFPGDRIDLVLTQAVPGGGDGPPLRVSETVMRNLRVLATDQRTDNEAGENGQTQVRTFSTVTLEVTPRIAEQVAVAQTLGSISLSLRSLADNNSQLEQAIASGTVNVPNGGGANAEHQMIVQAESAPSAGSSTFVTGADVSRFQRRSVPGRGGNDGSTVPGMTPAGPPLPPGATPTGGAFPGASHGPVVRIARGNTITEVPVGGGR